MGDIETPNSTGPHQTALLSVLPSKEFATSRKGMLLIAEVVRRDRQDSKRDSFRSVIPKVKMRDFAFLEMIFLQKKT